MQNCTFSEPLPLIALSFIAAYGVGGISLCANQPQTRAKLILQKNLSSLLCHRYILLYRILIPGRR